ncbi:MAG TPA: hypothetical protein PLY93_06065 [Turneriella sp.]|nr:hypothetical protein [Turneriella sp.]
MKEQNFLNTVTQRASHYTPGEQVNEEGWIKLNTNESPLPASPQVFATLKALASQVDVLRKYSHPLGGTLGYRQILSRGDERFRRSADASLPRNIGRRAQRCLSRSDV